MKEWAIPAFGAFIFWGVWGFLPKIMVQYISPRSAIVYEVLGGMLVALVIFWGLKFKPDVHPKGVLLAFATGMIGFLEALCFLTAVSKGPI